MNKVESEARYEIEMEEYVLRIQIEGRVLGDIILDGQSLRALLIQNGYAREYYGEAKQSWCN